MAAFASFILRFLTLHKFLLKTGLELLLLGYMI